MFSFLPLSLILWRKIHVLYTYSNPGETNFLCSVCDPGEIHVFAVVNLTLASSTTTQPPDQGLWKLKNIFGSQECPISINLLNMIILTLTDTRMQCCHGAVFAHFTSLKVSAKENTNNLSVFLSMVS
jgi:hypothetical protein